MVSNHILIHSAPSNVLGIFLWAKLVLSLVRDADSVSELHDALITMPQELSELYGRILDLLCTNQTEERTERMMRTLAWITFAKRPLMCHEILHGVALTSENPVLDTWNRLDRSAIDRCKPLIEELPNGSIVLIHSTLQEYDQFLVSSRWTSIEPQLIQRK